MGEIPYSQEIKQRPSWRVTAEADCMRGLMTLSLFGRLVFTSAAVLILLGGSILIAVTVLANPPNPAAPNETAEGLALIFLFVWPFVLLLVWICGMVALVIDGRPQGALPLLGIVIAAGLAVYVAVFLIILIAYAINRNVNFPLRGLPAILVILLFIALNTGAALFAWRYVLRAGSP